MQKLFLLLALLTTITSCRTSFKSLEDYESRLSKLIQKLESNERYRYDIFTINIEVEEKIKFQICPKGTNKPLHELHSGYRILISNYPVSIANTVAILKSKNDSLDIHELFATGSKSDNKSRQEKYDRKIIFYGIYLDNDWEKTIKIATQLIEISSKHKDEKIDLKVFKHSNFLG